MANEFTIAFNYEKAIKQADELLDISKDIRKIANDKMESSIQTIDKNWDGDSSKKFVNKSRQLKNKVVDSADDIQAVAGSIKEIAKRIYDAEMEAVRIAKEREAKLSS
ncbi:MAG: WXG100 family type VII secretion target [Lachnospiraceae bacterium]|nr:WXG100 family type VII secretion target [Lachnospiraceae bacterium]